MEIKITKLVKKYKDITAVDEVSLNVPSNKIFALLGVNGAGKTTTIKVLSGLLQKTSGSVYFDEYNLDKDINVIKQLSNISPQETAVAPNLTVRENLDFFAQIYGVKQPLRSEKIDKLLQTFSLQEVEKKRAKYLSGGMSRRLSIAIALLSNPQVLYLDEPTLGLDVLSRKKLWEIIKTLKEDTTIILTTHYMEEAEHLADEIAIMSNGKIIATGSPSKLKEKTSSQDLENAFIKIVEENEK